MIDAANLVDLAAGVQLNARGKKICDFNGQDVIVSRFSAHPRWEIHPNADEYLQVVAGHLKVRLLQRDGAVELDLHRDDICIVPKGTWHSPMPQGEVLLLSVSDYVGTLVSNADDPRS